MSVQEIGQIQPGVAAEDSPSYFLLRRGGLPFDLVEELGTPELAAWFRRGEQLRQDGDAARETLSRTLERRIIPEATDRTRRRAINLRRALRAGRVPDPDSATVRELSEEFPELVPDLARITAAAEDVRAHEGLGDQVAEAEVARVRSVLAAAATDPRLRQGILLQSRDLDGFLAAYGASAPTTKRVRRLERSLLNYVYRACAKTSPFSTLGVVGVGRIGTMDESGRSEMTLQTGKRLLVDAGLNLGVLGRIIDIVSGSDTLLRDVPLALNSSVEDWETRLRYVRRTRRAAKSDAPVDMGQLSESVFYLGSEHVTSAVVSILPPGRSLTSPRAAEELARAVQDDLPVEHVLEYLHALLRVGFLVTPVLVVDISSEHPVRDFARRLSELDCNWAPRTAAALRRLEELAQGYALADVTGRREIDSRMRGELAVIEEALGAPGRLTSLDTIVFEDVADPSTETVVSGTWWAEEVMPVLQDYGKLLSVYDPSGPIRLSMAAYFHARYGTTGVVPDVTTFLHEFGQDCFEQLQQAMLGHQDFKEDQTLSPLPNWFRLPELDQIDQAKLRIRDHLQQLIDQHGGAAHRVDLDRGWLSRMAEEIPSTGIWERDPRSYFVQVANQGPGSLAVLNKSYCGMGLHVSRFARLVDQGGEMSLTDYARDRNRVSDTATVLAELRGGLDTTNLNLHPHLTDYELVCPGEISFRPEREQIPLAALEIRSSPQDGLYLWSEAHQARVIPVYLGFLMPFALPTMQQALLLFSSANMAMPNLWNGVNFGSGARYPRIQVGPVVLRRESWFVPVEELPEIPAVATAAERYRAWRTWQAEQGLPDELFLQPRSSRSALGGDDEVPDVLAAKPQYVDLTSEVSLRLFDHNVRQQRGEIELVEMLPGRDELCADGTTGERYVAEFTIDINAPSEPRDPWKGKP